jgi:hypothetical protein
MLGLKRASPTRAELRSKHIAGIDAAVLRGSELLDPRPLAEHLELLAQNLRLRWATTAPAI